MKELANASWRKSLQSSQVKSLTRERERERERERVSSDFGLE